MKGERKNVQFARFSRRLTTEGLLKALLIVLAISFSIVFVVAAVAWYTESNVLWLCIGIVAAIALIGIPVIYFAFYRPTIQSNARRIDRLGLEDQYMEILGVKIPMNTIPITPGRNLAVILEVAAMNNRQRKMGFNAALEFMDQLNQQFDANKG